MNYFTVSTAKPKLGRLLDNVLKSGVPVVIRRGGRFLQITEYVVPLPRAQESHESFSAAEEPSEYGRANCLHFRINLFESHEGWSVSCPDLPACHALFSEHLRDNKDDNGAPYTAACQEVDQRISSSGERNDNVHGRSDLLWG